MLEEAGIDWKRIQAEGYVALPVDLKIDVEVSANMKKFRGQMEKPIFQALLSGEKTPEQAAEEYKTKGSQMFKQ